MRRNESHQWISHLEPFESILVTKAIEFCKLFCQIEPYQLCGMTIQGAINMEFGGLGGGIAIKGFLRRLLLLGVETGVQVHLVEMGFSLSTACQAHEWPRGSLKWVVVICRSSSNA